MKEKKKSRSLVDFLRQEMELEEGSARFYFGDLDDN